MISQVIFKIDSKIKKQALLKSKKEGIPLSYILKSAISDYVSSKKRLSLVEEDMYGDMEDFRQAGYDDILKILGPISKEESDYYQNLPALK